MQMTMTKHANAALVTSNVYKNYNLRGPTSNGTERDWPSSYKTEQIYET